MKFDFVIGNPPYQDETLGDNKGYAPPVYHKFLEESYKVANAVEMIHPARFLFNAGSTPKAWNEQMLSDPHIKVKLYEQDSSKVFSNTDIKGGVAVTYRDGKKKCGAIGTFTPYDELNSAMKKISENGTFSPLSKIVVTSYAYHFTNQMHVENPDVKSRMSKGHEFDLKSNIFQKLTDIFGDSCPDDGHVYIQILGRDKSGRAYKFVRRDYINEVENLDKYKIFLPKANGTGALGEVLSSPIVAGPAIGSTETFFSVGSFATEDEAFAALKYIKTKFTRALLGVLKTTQDITPDKWRMVPLQDFTPNSDIDWTGSVAEIDQQLYRKYGLSDNEIAFIETKVKEMI